MRIERWEGREKFPNLHTHNQAFIAESVKNGRIYLMDWIASFFFCNRSQYAEFSCAMPPSRFWGSWSISSGSFIVFNLCEWPSKKFFHPAFVFMLTIASYATRLILWLVISNRTILLPVSVLGVRHGKWTLIKNNGCFVLQKKIVTSNCDIFLQWIIFNPSSTI